MSNEITHHQICEGCIDGRRLVEDIDMLNESRADINSGLLQDADKQKADLEKHVESMIAMRGGDSFPGAEVARDMVAHVAETVDAVLKNNELPMQQVECQGPTRILRRCGAHAIKIS